MEGAMQQAAQWGRQVIMQIRKGSKQLLLGLLLENILQRVE